MANEDAVFTIAGSPRLAVRRRKGAGAPVLYVQGATIPASLAVSYRFSDGVSWEDNLAHAGHDVWALDFEGFGASERPAAFAAPANASPQILRSASAAEQIVRAVLHIRAVRGDDAPVAIIAHSWGTIPAAKYATEHPSFVSKLILFGPILTRDGQTGPDPAQIPAWRMITLAQQLARFVEDVPAGAPPVLEEPDLARWGPAWLATDGEAMTHNPPALKIPGGPTADIAATWRGASLYDPKRLTAPTLIVRGAWDSLCTNADVARFSVARGAAVTDVIIPRGTHLMHLETGRHALYAACAAFLSGADPNAAAQRVRAS